MDAIISGRAGVAFLVEGEAFSSFDVEDPATLLPRRPADLRLLFGEAPDVEFFEGVNHDVAARHLERAFNCASALDLALIIFDTELTDDLRDDAAEELERLLSEQPVAEYLENVLYGWPLPAAADLAGALARCAGGRLPKLSSLLQILEGYQPSIRAVRAAWDDLPAHLFGGNDQKADFQHAAVREGLFRQLTIEAASGPNARTNEFIVSSGLNPAITVLRSHLKILQQWASPFRPHAVASRPHLEVEDFLEDAPTKRRGQRRHRRRWSAVEALEKLQGQIDLVVTAMRRRDIALARKITDEILVYQSTNATPLHTAKTLCNLATKAKALGVYSLSLELTERAIQISPDDGWSWAQYADALLILQRPAEALKAYEQAEAFGAGIVAKSGRAEALRVLGRLDEVLAVYDVIATEYPNSVTPKIGRAEVLKALGRLVEALAAYEAIVAEHPENIIAKTGRAEVLKYLGRLVDALEAYDDTIAEHPENFIAKTMRADTLIALGNFHEALAAYDSIVAEHPENVVAKNGRAETLRAMGRLTEALEAYESTVTEHPEDVVAKTGRAETLRDFGRLAEALAAYDSIVAEHPENVVTKNGRAETLRAMGRLTEALEAYDSTIARHPENVVAKTERAETLRAMGRLHDALAAYDSVVTEHPESVTAKMGLADVLKALGLIVKVHAVNEATVVKEPDDLETKAVSKNIEVEEIQEGDLALQPDWMNYHMQGINLLIKGNVKEAFHVIEQGAMRNREAPA